MAEACAKGAAWTATNHIECGIDQGCQLSVILYAYYNPALVEAADPKKGEMAEASMDDVAVLVVGKTFEAVHAQLGERNRTSADSAHVPRGAQPLPPFSRGPSRLRTPPPPARSSCGQRNRQIDAWGACPAVPREIPGR